MKRLKRYLLSTLPTGAVVPVVTKAARTALLPRTLRLPTVPLGIIGLRSVGWSTDTVPNIGHFRAIRGCQKGVSGLLNGSRGLNGTVGFFVSKRAVDLSDRELAILSGAARGLTNRELASRFYIAEATVRRHLANVYE